MKQKPALFLSVALSIFVLATLAAVISFSATPATAESNNDEQVAQALAEQEAAYSQLIADANQQLSDAQTMINSLQSSYEPADEPQDGISAEQAHLAASQVAQGGNQASSDPELVNFEGAVAYEVGFPAGNIYVDAVSGEVIFNGTIEIIPADITAERAVQLASNYLGNDQVYRVEQQTRDGEQVFHVRFLNGDEVYVSIKGELLLVRLADNVQANAGDDSQSSYHDDDYDDDDDEHEEHEYEDHDDDDD